MRVLPVSVGILLLALPLAGWQPSGALKIVVLEGEDGVNIIQQRTAVQPVVEVRDRNNLPVSGAVVTFTVGGGGGGATFANSLKVIQVTTDATGRAAVSGLQPVSSGTLNIQVSASYQGQTASASITQTNFATAADAAAAGKTPGSQSSANTSGASSGGGAGGAGSAGAGGAAGGGAGATAGTTGAVGGAAGGGGGLSGLALGGIIAGGAVGGVVAANAIGGGSDPGDPAGGSGPRCTAQENALNAESNAFGAQLNSFIACVNSAFTEPQFAACQAQLNPSFQRFLGALDAYCTCLGPDFNLQLTPDERRQVQEAFNTLRSLGFNVGNLPRCYQ